MYYKKRVLDLITALGEVYPEAKAELNFKNDFELLVAVILSAQCTDKRVNIITEDLFKVANTPKKMVDLGEEKIRSIIMSCGMYKQKAKNIYNTSKILFENYQSLVPDKMEELIGLPGVGRKTANVVMSVAFDKPAIAVDTHVKRLSNRLGLSKSDNPLVVEKDLMKIIPKDKWTVMHHRLIFHGRRRCKARKPDCANCEISGLCPKIGV